MGDISEKIQLVFIQFAQVVFSILSMRISILSRIRTW